MARHNKREFSALCSIETKNLSVYISRGKVVLDDNDLIDDTHPTNKDFILRQHNKKGKPKADAPVTKNMELNEDEKREATERISYVKSQRAKVELDLAEKQNRIELQKIEIEKKRGELLPTQDVKTVLTFHSESIKNSFVEGADGIIVLYAQKGGLNADDIAFMRRKLTDLVNKAIDDSIASSKAMLVSIVKEFSTKRGIGQHE